MLWNLPKYATSAAVGSLSLIATLAVTASAENWTRFRGPDGTGIANPGFSTAITEKNIAWKVALPGVGHSSPVTWDDHVYVTSADDRTARRYVLCLAAIDSKVLWKCDEPFTAYHKHNDNSYASATPATDNLGVYVAWTTPGDYTLTALSHDGKERWRKSLGRYQSQNGGGSSPIVVDDMVILNDDQEGANSTLYAFDRTTGATRWKIDHASSGKAAMSTPCVWSPAAGPRQLIVTTWEGGIQGIDLHAGKTLWQAPDVFFSRPIGSPVTTGDLVIGVNGDSTGKRVLVAVRPSSEHHLPGVIYKLDGIGPYVPTPLIKGDHLLMWNEQGQLTCAKAATGEIIWTQKLGGGFYGSPICSGDVLWSISRSGNLIGVNIADVYKLLCRFDLGEPSHATPALANGRMYLRTMSRLICVKATAN